MMKILVAVLSACCLGYLVLCGVIFYGQNSLIFPGAKAQQALYKQYTANAIFLSNNDVTLQGWHLVDTSAQHKFVIIYFGGNAEDVVTMLPILSELDVTHLYTFNYRSYGLSEGTPSQENIYRDALVIYDELAQRHNNTTQFILIGRSLGSAVAGHLANQRPARALILLTPLQSVAHRAQSILPFIPIKALLKHPFDLEMEAKLFELPVLMLTAQNDRVISARESHATYTQITSSKQEQQIGSVGHNNLFAKPQALHTMKEFLSAFVNNERKTE